MIDDGDHDCVKQGGPVADNDDNSFDNHDGDSFYVNHDDDNFYDNHDHDDDDCYDMMMKFPRVVQLLPTRRWRGEK